MAIAVTTVFSGIDVDAGTGTIFIKANKQIWNGDVLLQSIPHRHTVEASEDMGAALTVLDDSLVGAGFSRLPANARTLATAVRNAVLSDGGVKAAMADIQARRKKET